MSTRLARASAHANMMNNTGCEDGLLICSRLTAAGRGAIAVVAIRGKNASQAIDQSFLPIDGKSFLDKSGRKLVYGTWRSTNEDVVVCRLESEQFEVHCHGGSAAVDSIVTRLVDFGATEVSPTTLLETVTDDFWRTEVLRALPNAATERAATHLLRQVTNLPAAIAKIRQNILLNQFCDAISSIDEVLGWSPFGLFLSQVPTVVLCGQPNVGKSSLINAIVGFQRAIVHQMAGTTRDVVSQKTAVEGWPIELTDTAGLREAKGVVEEKGIENARQRIGSASVVVGVFDSSRAWSSTDQGYVEMLKCDLIVHNKSDQALTQDADRPVGIMTSATEHLGIDMLAKAISHRLVPREPSIDAAFCPTESGAVRLKQVRDCLIDNSFDAEVKSDRALRLLTSGSCNSQ